MVKEKIYGILEEVLGIDREEAKLNEETDIFDDLAAESIDLVDICFRLEKDFGLGKVNPNDIFPSFLQNDGAVDDKGNMSKSSIERLQNEYPHSRKNLIGELTNTKDLRTFLKVKNLTAFVEYRLGEKQNGN